MQEFILIVTWKSSMFRQNKRKKEETVFDFFQFIIEYIIVETVNENDKNVS